MVESITPAQAQQLIESGEVEVVDVRELHEWLTGHLAAARHVPLARFRSNPKLHLTHDGVIFVCAAGVRSNTAAQLAEAAGFRRVYNLAGGTRAWVNAGFTLERAARKAG
jgi:rhodanese-related sulfurtransferase